MEYTQTRSIRLRSGKSGAVSRRDSGLFTGVGGFSIFEEAPCIGQGVGHVNDEPKAV